MPKVKSYSFSEYYVLYYKRMLLKTSRIREGFYNMKKKIAGVLFGTAFLGISGMIGVAASNSQDQAVSARYEEDSGALCLLNMDETKSKAKISADNKIEIIIERANERKRQEEERLRKEAEEKARLKEEARLKAEEEARVETAKQEAAKQEAAKKQQNTQNTTNKSPAAPNPSQNKYSANTIIFGGKTVYYRNASSMGQSQGIIDGNKSLAATWGGAITYSGTDGMNTHFISHRDGGFYGLWNLGVGSSIVVTDGNGTPFTYKVSGIVVVDETGTTEGGKSYYDDIVGTGGGERITLQTCHPSKPGYNYIYFARLN